MCGGKVHLLRARTQSPKEGLRGINCLLECWGVIDSSPIYYWHMKHSVVAAADKLLWDRSHAYMAFISTGSASLLCSPLHKQLFGQKRCWLTSPSLVILWTLLFTYSSMQMLSYEHPCF